MRPWIIFAVFLCTGYAAGQAGPCGSGNGTCTAISCALTDVSAVISSSVGGTGGVGTAIAGDTVVLPVCTAPSQIGISTITRATNVVTAVLTSSATSYYFVNGFVSVNSSTGGTTSFNGYFQLTGVSGTQLTWAQTGANESGNSNVGFVIGCGSPNQCWNSTLTITDLVNFKGSDTINSDLICYPVGTLIANLNGTHTGGCGSIAGGNTALAQTVIVDAIDKSSCGDHPLLFWNVPLTSNGKLRISSFSPESSAADPGQCAEEIKVVAASHSFRMDDITWLNQTTTAASLWGDLQGVVDHSTVGANNTGVSVSAKRGIWIKHQNWAGVGVQGDNSWAVAPTYGTTQQIVVENLTSNESANTGTGNVSYEGGARVTVRNSQLTGLGVGTHGLDTTLRQRSSRHGEIYNNSINDQNVNTGFITQLRGGSMLVWGNAATAQNAGSYPNLTSWSDYRDTNSWTPWGVSSAKGGCDGYNPFDNGDGVTYFSGTAGTGSTSDNLVDPGANFTGGLTGDSTHVAYDVHNVTQDWGSYITGFTSTSIQSHASSQGQTHPWAVGTDQYVVVRTQRCIDGVGNGSGILLSGGSDVVAPTPVGWPNQAVEPVYEWLNTRNGTTVTSTGVTESAHILQNRDYYDYQTSCSNPETTGVCSGVFGNRPASCTAGVAYWATDQNVLYKCIVSGWSTYYQPLQYPHPLIVGLPSNATFSQGVTISQGVSYQGDFSHAPQSNNVNLLETYQLADSVGTGKGNTVTLTVGLNTAEIDTVTTGILITSPVVNLTTTPSVSTISQNTLNLGLNENFSVSTTVTTTGGGCGPPTYKCSNKNTTNVIPGPNTPPSNLIGLYSACGHGVPCWVADPNFTNIQGRISDFSTVSMLTNSSASARVWNSDTTIFETTTSGGSHTFTKFDISSCPNGNASSCTATNPPTVTIKGTTGKASDSTILTSMEWGGVNNHTFYSGGGKGYGTRATINKDVLDTTQSVWGQSAITSTVLEDPFTDCVGLTTYDAQGIWNQYINGNPSDTNVSVDEHVVGNGYQYVQDTGGLVVLYDSTQAVGHRCSWINIFSGQVSNNGGAVQATTGFTPMPAPAAPTLTGSTSGGSLACGDVYKVQVGFTLQNGTGTRNYGGESLPSSSATVTPGVSGSTCSITVTLPNAQPGGSAGNLTASGFSLYACDNTANPGCSPVEQTNGTNPSGALARPVISSLTCTGGGSFSMTYQVVALNASGASVYSAPVSTNCNQFPTSGNFVTVKLASTIANATSCEVLRNYPIVTAGTFNCATGTSFNDTAQFPRYFVDQITSATINPTITSLYTNTPAPPTQTTAGELLHNIRIDQSGQWVTLHVATPFCGPEGSTLNGYCPLEWHKGTTAVLPDVRGGCTNSTICYPQPHETMGWSQLAVHIGAGSNPCHINGVDIPVMLTLSDSIPAINASDTIFNCSHKDTQSGDTHWAWSNSIQGAQYPVFQDSYSGNGTFSGNSSHYVLPNVPWDGELQAWGTDGSNNHWRFFHNWTSGANGFYSSPRGNISQNGQWYIFNSDMQRNGSGLQGTAAVGLGSAGGATTCTPGSTGSTECNVGLFIGQLN